MLFGLKPIPPLLRPLPCCRWQHQLCCRRPISNHLLSLLRRHSHLGVSLQIHSQLITSGHGLTGGTSIIFLWNTLIHRYSLSPSPSHSLLIYRHVLSSRASELDSFTFSFLFKACAASLSHSGLPLHSLVVKNGFAFHVYVHTSLVTMYAFWGSTADARKAFDEMPQRSLVSWNAMLTGLARCGEMEAAKSVFDQMPDRNVVSWTGLIDGCTRSKMLDEAVSLFRRMAGRGISPSEITVLAISPAIASLGALDAGETLHCYCLKGGLHSIDVRVENSLIDMYAKCGSIESSVQIFEEMSGRRNLVSWTSIISGLAMHGLAEEAIWVFGRIEREKKLKPNKVTFLSLLNACSHGGLVEEGARFFIRMVNEHGVEPEMKHYSCLIDMFGRAGRLREAEEMIAGMSADAVVWRTLLGCCCKHGEAEMGERVMKRIMEQEKKYGGDYVLLSNMLAEAGRFDDAESVRRLLDCRNAVKVPGISLI